MGRIPETNTGRQLSDGDDRRALGLLNVTIETHDPVYYTRPFLPVTATYARSELALQPFGCTPEVDH